MSKMMLRTLCFLFIIIFQISAQQTLKIVTYNLLRYGTGQERNAEFRTIMNAIDPDVLVVQEMQSQAGVDNYLNNVLNQSGSEFSAGRFIDGNDTDNALFYKSSKISFVSNIAIITTLRNISQFTVVYTASDDTLLIYSLHLKASQGDENEQRRLSEVNELRRVTDMLPASSNFVVLGDLNVYRSGEPAYQALLDQSNSGYVLDPIDAPGSWNNNASFAAIHTQSTRTSSFGGGATGGLDDRFDQLLISEGISSPGGIDFVSGSYHSFGNDGNHYNQAINQQPNNVVSSAVANALHEASDHLPVVMELSFEPATALHADNRIIPSQIILHQNYPNPFNPATTIEYELAKPAAVVLSVYDVLGVKVAEIDNGQRLPGSYRIQFDASQLSSGVYYYQILGEVRKMVLMK